MNALVFYHISLERHEFDYDDSKASVIIPKLLQAGKPFTIMPVEDETLLSMADDLNDWDDEYEFPEYLDFLCETLGKNKENVIDLIGTHWCVFVTDSETKTETEKPNKVRAENGYIATGSDGFWEYFNERPTLYALTDDGEAAFQSWNDEGGYDDLDEEDFLAMVTSDDTLCVKVE